MLVEKTHDFLPSYSENKARYEDLSSVYREFFVGECGEVVVDRKVRGLCFQPYYKHPKGCPNLGQREDCPPVAGFFPKIFKEDGCLVAAVVFDFKTYIELKKEKHPGWSNRALANQRHWQAHLRAELSKQVGSMFEEGIISEEEYVFVSNPEAMGVNLQKTCELAGLELLWPEQDEKGKLITLPEYICQVGLLAKSK